MLTEQTLQQLQSLNLLEMARKWQEQQRDPQMAELSFDERFGLLV
ncbi:MAG: IstB-like ATP-binding domain-containing protein, partial [Myxococcales bacterium]|nr:IstB-like ATP-binding domain-containing protein [Myxococcales bacterium]